MSSKLDIQALKAEKMQRLKELQKRKQQMQEQQSQPNTMVSSDIIKIISKIKPQEAGDMINSRTQPAEQSSPTKILTRTDRMKLKSCQVVKDIAVESAHPRERLDYPLSMETDKVPELGQRQIEDEEEEREELEFQRKLEEEKAKEAAEREQRRIADKKKAEETLLNDEPREAQALSDTEKAAILQSSEFSKFLNSSSVLVELALKNDYDFCKIAIHSEKEEKNEQSTKQVTTLMTYSCKQTEGRVVTALDFPREREDHTKEDNTMFLAAFNANEDNPNEPDGIVCLYEHTLSSRPFEIYESQSAVLSCRFSPFNPDIIVGGTYSGQIMLWDRREPKNTPVQRSSLTAVSHTHPVYCLDFVGSKNAHDLVTLSTDGKMCTWNLDMLTTPRETMELQHGSNNKAISPTCMSFPQGDFNNFVVGSEEGQLYPFSRHGNKAGTASQEFKSHSGPITAVDFHKCPGPNGEFSDHFLSCSTDWSVKLWSYRSPNPIYSFEDAGDYVFDVQFSPAHPSLFASADGMGEIDFWNPNVNTEAPIFSQTVGESKTPSGDIKKTAINKIKWASSGERMLVGDASGKVHLLKIASNIAQPRPEEWAFFKDTLKELKQSLEDVEAVVSGTSTLA